MPLTTQKIVQLIAFLLAACCKLGIKLLYLF